MSTRWQVPLVPGTRTELQRDLHCDRIEIAHTGMDAAKYERATRTCNNSMLDAFLGSELTDLVALCWVMQKRRCSLGTITVGRTHYNSARAGVGIPELKHDLMELLDCSPECIGRWKMVIRGGRLKRA